MKSTKISIIKVLGDTGNYIFTIIIPTYMNINATKTHGCLELILQVLDLDDLIF